MVDSLDGPIGRVSVSWLLVLVGIAATMWIQVGHDRRDGVNPLVIAFPLVGVVTGVLIVVVLLRVGLGRFRRTGRGLPTPLFLAWRALTASANGALMLTASIGVASGLVALSVSFVGTIDAATEAKAATLVGAVSRLDTIDKVDTQELPPGSTVVFSQTTRIGSQPVKVVVLDPLTFAQVVTWPAQFGRSPSELVDLLGESDLDAVPAVAVGAVPERGEFGVQRVFPYQVVGLVNSAPLASATSPTLIIRADVFESYAQRRWDLGQESIDPVDQEIADTLGRELPYISPLTKYGHTVLHNGSLRELEAVAERLGWRVTATATLAGQTGDVDVQTTRWAFDYLGLLAVVAGLVALGVLSFYLAERRRQREVTTAMTQQMGVPNRTNVIAAVIEMVGLVAAAIAAGAVSAAVTAHRVFPTFEPDPEVPPTVPLSIDVPTLLVVFGVAVALVAFISAWSQRSISQTQKATVFRG
ncbi:MAG: FtsX-like permease family protein [Acidimicrobiales bacterium]